MDFSSIPAYLDPTNWHQQQNDHIIVSSNGANPLFPPPPPPPHGGGGSIRPGSMAERARMANIPMPETPLKCPRCDSTNTKFCYFNNYSLSQPRHFCKTCRRYWTRGGALRNVPVGGGCRRNKRTKSSSSKSPSSSSDRQKNSTSTSGVSTALTPQFPPLRFMSPLSQLSDGFNMGMNYSGMTAPAGGTNEMNFQGAANFLGGGGSGGMAALLSSEGGDGGGIEQWRLQQQFPFLGNLDTSSAAGVYQFHHGVGEPSHQVRPKVSETAPVKKENNGAEQRQQPVLGNEQWNAATSWTELSGFSSSSTSNPL